MPNQINRRRFLGITSTIGLAASASQLEVPQASANSQNPLLTVHSRLESESWLMPAHFGSPKWAQPYPDQPGKAHYGDVTGISISYLTDEK